MCVVSMVMDHYSDKWGWRIHQSTEILKITNEEVEEFKKLLERAREYDIKNNEPDCEIASKREKLQKLADELGVDISFVDERKGKTDESN